VDRATLKALFPLADLDIFYREPSSDVELAERYLPNKLWRMNVLYKIKNKSGRVVRFVLNDAQLKVYKELLSHPRLIILKSRQRGISTFMLICYFDDALIEGVIEAGMMAQGEKEMENLFDKVKLLWRELDDSVLRFLSLHTVKDTTKAFEWNNLSKMYLQLSFRSGTLQRFHVSEYAKISKRYPERAKETRSGSLQAILPTKDNLVVIESTAEGDNDFKRMWDGACELDDKERSYNDFKPVFLSWLDDPDCVLSVPQRDTPISEAYFKRMAERLKALFNLGDRFAKQLCDASGNVKVLDVQRWWWIAKLREMDNDMELMLREYPAYPEEAFYLSIEGVWYKDLYEYLYSNNRFSLDFELMYDDTMPVAVAFDLGVDDNTVLLYSQYTDFRINMLDISIDSGRDIVSYCKEIKGKALIEGWTIGLLILPHDARNRHISSNKTVYDIVVEHFPDAIVHVVERAGVLADQIKEVRRVGKSFYLSERCDVVKGMFQNYRMKVDANGMPTGKDVHDEWSHIADAVRYLSQVVDSGYYASVATTLHSLRVAAMMSHYSIDEEREYDTIYDGLSL